MSSYRDKAINPKSGKLETAWFLDDAFGRHKYGIRFDGEVHIYPAHEVEVPSRADRRDDPGRG